MKSTLAKGKDWHDAYFRKVMQFPIVRNQFLSWLAPKELTRYINFNNIKMLNTTYIDKSLSKTFSDVVFDCHYKSKDKDNSARIIILIEHQSTPERFLPIRVHHYMLSMLNKLLDEQRNHKNNKQASTTLPAIYPIIYYNGKTKAYPYSTKLQKCLDGPEQAKKYFCNEDIQVVNVNKLTQQDIEQHQLAGVMVNAMKRTKKSDTPQNYHAVLSQLNHIQTPADIPLGFTESTIEYMMNVKAITNLDELINQSLDLSEHIRGEAMTIAEALEQRGREKGQADIAINLLNKGMPAKEIAEVTELDLSVVQQLQQQNTKPHSDKH